MTISSNLDTSGLLHGNVMKRMHRTPECVIAFERTRSIAIDRRSVHPKALHFIDFTNDLRVEAQPIVAACRMRRST